MAKSNQKTPVVFRLGIILLCCMLFTTYLMGNLYARYTTTASGSDSARVAKFKVGSTFTDEDSQINVDLHFFDATKITDTITVVVSSESEVAVRYNVTVTMPENIDYTQWLSIELQGETYSKNSLIATDADTYVFTFETVGEFAPNDSTAHTYTLTFKINDAYIGNPPAGLADVIDGKVMITVHSEQID